MRLAHSMIKQGTKGSIVCLVCDSGERYKNTYYNEEWLQVGVGLYRRGGDQHHA